MSLKQRPLPLLHRFFRHTRAVSSLPPVRASPDTQEKQDARLTSAVNWAHKVLDHPDGRALPPPTTICAYNVPPDVPIDEFLHLVLFGPLFLINDRILPHGRVISLTFFENATAVAFFREVTAHDVVFRGASVRFEWAPGPDPRRRITTRALFVHNVGRLGTSEEFHARMARHGPIDRVLFTNNYLAAFVDYLSPTSAVKAVEDLRKEGIRVGFANDRCWTAGTHRAAALESGARQVILGSVPPGAAIRDLCDQIRGGALEKIEIVQHTAFVNFLAHTSAAAFYQYALYHGITLDGRRLTVNMKPDQPALTRLVPHLAHSVQRGVTRCIHVAGVPDSNTHRIRLVFAHFGRVERLEILDGSATVAYADIRDAIMAARKLWRIPGYEDTEVEFAPDPCAAPVPAAQKAAQTLQARIAGFLTLPPR
ncbi:hypothetical protein C8R44DRAFT_876092 [Mycena epipterygia]|nr:hypothetical protein C8R44DRAFT_876092 [Mycena epipterygia]